MTTGDVVYSLRFFLLTACAINSGSPVIVRDIFQAHSRPFQGPFPKFSRPYLILKNTVTLPTYTMPREVKFFKQNTLVQS